MGQLDDRPPWAMAPAVAPRYDEAIHRLAGLRRSARLLPRLLAWYIHTRY